jgi:hypothetical protein
MFLCAMLFRSLKNLFLCITCHGMRAIKSYLTAFQFIHFEYTGTLLRALSYKSSEIILCETFQQLGFQLLQPHFFLDRFL